LFATYLLYIYSKYVAVMENKTAKQIKPFDTKESIRKSIGSNSDKSWFIETPNKAYRWKNNFERINIIREGIPFDVFDTLSKQLNLPVKTTLSMIGMPQTTYNKKKNEQTLLDRRNSELVILIVELIQYGFEVFNNEEGKFQRWLKKQQVEDKLEQFIRVNGEYEVNVLRDNARTLSQQLGMEQEFVKLNKIISALLSS